MKQEVYDIRFEAIKKDFGSVNVIPSLNLKIHSGERLVLLGPSGCGKTTTMRLIAGLEQPSSGEIYMGEKKVNDRDPSERNVAMVFQNYALYPHMTVFENMSFALRLRKTSKDEISKRVQEAAGMLGLEHLLNRKPRELSGGQRQRVALGRAIVRRAPYFLLDEPLSNLDAQLRSRARNELVELHEKLQTTMVYVTHDQVEAMTIGQRIAIMKNGSLQQIGTPSDIYNCPVNTFVATFIGNPSMNLIPLIRTDTGVLLRNQEQKLPDELMAILKQHSEKEILLGIRPESIDIEETASDNYRVSSYQKGISMSGKYVRSEYLGNLFIHHIDIQDVRIQVTTPKSLQIHQNSSITLKMSLDNIHIFTGGEEQKRIELPIWKIHSPIPVFAAGRFF